MMKAVSSYYYTNLLFFFPLALTPSLNYHMYNSLKGQTPYQLWFLTVLKIFHCHSGDKMEQCALASINHTWMWICSLVFFSLVLWVPFLHGLREDKCNSHVTNSFWMRKPFWNGPEQKSFSSFIHPLKYKKTKHGKHSHQSVTALFRS